MKNSRNFQNEKSHNAKGGRLSTAAQRLCLSRPANALLPKSYVQSLTSKPLRPKPYIQTLTSKALRPKPYIQSLTSKDLCAKPYCQGLTPKPCYQSLTPTSCANVLYDKNNIGNGFGIRLWTYVFGDKALAIRLWQ